MQNTDNQSLFLYTIMDKGIFICLWAWGFRRLFILIPYGKQWWAQNLLMFEFDVKCTLDLVWFPVPESVWFLFGFGVLILCEFECEFWCKFNVRLMWIWREFFDLFCFGLIRVWIDLPNCTSDPLPRNAKISPKLFNFRFAVFFIWFK